MHERASRWHVGFAAVAALELLGEATGFRPLVFLTKPLLMPVLALWFARETSDENLHQTARRLLIGGLLLATAGDVLLMLDREWPGRNLFLFGLGAFLATHLCYAAAFLRLAGGALGYVRRAPWVVLLLLLYLAGLLALLNPGLGALRLPVVAYGATITFMALTAINLRDHAPPRAYRWIVAGALLFVLSDSLIGIHRFAFELPAAGVAIMLTYIAGQYLIARGVKEFFWE
jgi:uncharacterized membrane protein YhhN